MLAKASHRTDARQGDPNGGDRAVPGRVVSCSGARPAAEAGHGVAHAFERAALPLDLNGVAHQGALDGLGPFAAPSLHAHGPGKPGQVLDGACVRVPQRAVGLTDGREVLGNDRLGGAVQRRGIGREQ